MAVVCHKHQLLYVPVPKNACSSIKSLMFELENGFKFSPVDQDGKKITSIHQVYFSHKFSFERVKSLVPEWRSYFKFCVVRDPLRRFVSAYRNRVLFHGELSERALAASRISSSMLLPNPPIEYFVEHLSLYRIASWSMMHHTDPQVDFLGDWLDFYDYICPFEELSVLSDQLSLRIGRAISLERLQDGGPPLDVSTLRPATKKQLYQYYEKDYLALRKYYA